jgi:uncharacterized protein (TIGR03086 family)
VNVIEAHRLAGERFRDTVRAVPADGWSWATPCTEWDVRALVNHVVGEDRWTVPLMVGQTIAAVGEALAGDLLGDDPVAAADQAWAEAVAVVPAAVSAGMRVHLSYGEEAAEEYAWQLTSDHLIHTWDLAVAIGVEPALDADVVAAVAGWFGGREAELQATGLFGSPVPLPADASRLDRLLAVTGRDPRWSRQ